MDRLAKIEHVKIVRFHTRVPAVDPAAVTDEMVAALKRSARRSMSRCTPTTSAN
jgi:lysine 2,3-aminomutase